MLHLLRRHPLPIRAWFDFVLVVTWAFPAEALRPLLPPGLQLDEWKGRGFLAVAFVRTRRLRPAFLPGALGGSFFLVGYRIFCRYTTPTGRTLRGLRILRTETDRRLMTWAGNLLTRYGYHKARVRWGRGPRSIEIAVATGDGQADVRLEAEIGSVEELLPDGSPFADGREARRFAGPMPFTFEYEPETHSIIRVRGRRANWTPRLVPVTVEEMGFLRSPHLGDHEPDLASCFYIEDIDYRWDRGVCEPLADSGPPVGPADR